VVTDALEQDFDGEFSSDLGRYSTMYPSWTYLSLVLGLINLDA
jgi:hypothetical protein